MKKGIFLKINKRLYERIKSDCAKKGIFIYEYIESLIRRDLEGK